MATRTYFVIPETAITDDYEVGPARRARIFTRDGNRCVYCGVFTTAPWIDHVRPASSFAVGAPREVVSHTSNLVTACKRCNLKKGGCGLMGFAEKLLDLGIEPAAVEAMLARVRDAQARPLP